MEAPFGVLFVFILALLYSRLLRINNSKISIAADEIFYLIWASSNFLNNSERNSSILEKANHFLPKSLSEAPM